MRLLPSVLTVLSAPSLAVGENHEWGAGRELHRRVLLNRGGVGKVLNASASASTTRYSSSLAASSIYTSTTTRAPSPSPSLTTTSPSTSLPTSAPFTSKLLGVAAGVTATTSSTSTSLVCAPKYAAPTMITGTGTLPKPTSFVKKTFGSQGLTLDGKVFRIVGPNMYWLCQDENVLPVGYYTDKRRVREALAIAVAMGANTIRAISCATSVGSKYSIMPSQNHYYATNATQWDIHDYVIYAAGQYGLRVIMPLTDNYDYYTGGKYTFLRNRNVSTANFGAAFYTNLGVIIDYRRYVTNILSHVNKFNGLMYLEDPTILAWETGNELGGYIGYDGYPPFKWSTQVLEILKGLDANHLIIDGTDGFYNYTTKVTPDGLGIKAMDIMSDHGYPRNIALLKAEVPLVQVNQRQKNFLIGEYDWTNSFGGDSLSDYLAFFESNGNYLGDMMWGVMGHDDQCCAFVKHNDGYSAYYPNGNTPDLQANLLLVVQHWYRITGRTIPSQLPGVACPQPVF